MSNKPHERPHSPKRRMSKMTRLLVAILMIALFLVGLALSATGHPIVLR
jgi:cytochrome b561